MTDLVKCTFTGGPAGDWLSVWHIDRLLGGSAQDSVDTVSGFWGSLASWLGGGVTVTVQGSVEIVDPITGQPTGVDSATSRVTAFTASGDVLPWQTQGLIYWNTGSWVGGRQVRGRTFIPANIEGYTDAVGNPSGSYLAALNTAADLISSSSLSVPGIYSRKHHNTYPIASHTVQSKWAVMRTRR